MSVHVRLFATQRNVSHEASMSMGSFWQKYWNGLSFPSPKDLPSTGLRLHLLWILHCRCFWLLSLWKKPLSNVLYHKGNIILVTIIFLFLNLIKLSSIISMLLISWKSLPVGNFTRFLIVFVLSIFLISEFRLISSV